MKWILILGVVMIAGLFFWFSINKGVVKEDSSKKSEKVKKEKKIKENKSEQSSDVKIVNKWELPGVLKEVSGIAFINDNQFACVQDEQGTIFIYNISSGEIEKKINFNGPGDYEGIAINGNMAYVVRADGTLFEVDMYAGDVKSNQYKTALTANHNVEGLCLDKKNNRLLLAIKDDEPGNKNYKGIYSFDLASKTLSPDPVMKIDLTHEMLNNNNGKKKNTIRPSDLNKHPLTNEIYVLDGPGSRLMIMDESGNIKELLVLGKEFSQAEGISFSPAGEIFISNEGTKAAGNIIQIQLNVD